MFYLHIANKPVKNHSLNLKFNIDGQLENIRNALMIAKTHENLECDHYNLKMKHQIDKITICQKNQFVKNSLKK